MMLEAFGKNPQVFTDGDGVAIPIIERAACPMDIKFKSNQVISLHC